MSSDLRYNAEFSGSTVFLVAFCVQGIASREVAEAVLLTHLPRPDGCAVNVEDENNGWLDCWWVAEDDRHDGSDCDSAVFVPKGQQTSWARQVRDADYECPGCFEHNECKCSSYEQTRITISALEELLNMPDLMHSRGWTTTQVQEIIDDRMKEL